MSSNIREFEMGLEAFAKKEVPEAVGDFRDAVALEGLKGVVDLTPVDTGRLRANWQTTVGEPAEGDVDREDKREAEGGNVAVTEGTRVIASAADRPFEPIWLHNGVEYAVHVDSGTAKVPAVHMVDQTVARLKRQFRSGKGSR